MPSTYDFIHLWHDESVFQCRCSRFSTVTRIKMQRKHWIAGTVQKYPDYFSKTQMFWHFGKFTWFVGTLQNSKILNWSILHRQDTMCWLACFMLSTGRFLDFGQDRAGCFSLSSVYAMLGLLCCSLSERKGISICPKMLNYCNWNEIALSWYIHTLVCSQRAAYYATLQPETLNRNPRQLSC